MVTLLIIIYLSFISLGLPDSLLGSSWPLLHQQLNVPISFIGIITIVISGGTIISSLLSDKLTCRFGSGKITAISVLMTALALLGFSISNKFYLLIIFAIPLGFGAGAVDSALNNYVALHFSSKHMNWLHCFWGVGASISPYIMSYFLSNDGRWDYGYLTVGFIQVVISIALFVSLPIWKKNKQDIKIDDEKSHARPFKEVIRLKGLFYVLFAFLCYCSFESTVFSFASSYLVISKKFSVENAAMYASMFYLGMTISRLLAGFISEKIGDKNMIRIGYTLVLVAIIFLIIPFTKKNISIVSLFVLGMGCGPIYPSIIHLTPKTFGKENSQTVVGFQMAFAYSGSTFMAPLFGVIANHISISLFPFYLLIFAFLGLILIEIALKITLRK